jgi:hypothetical protein
MSDPRNHMGRTALAIIPFGLLCLAGWMAEWIGRGAGRLDAACWRAMGRIERWAEIGERSDG